MSHLIQILTTGQINTLPHDETKPAYPQILAALQAEDSTVNGLDALPHEPGQTVAIWASEDAFPKGRPLNLAASAYAGRPVYGTAAITGFNHRTLTIRALTEDETYETKATTLKLHSGLEDDLRALAALTH